MSSSKRQALRHAFTLIELLVVIAIVAILASILFPVFGQARESARQIVCASEMHQIGLAMRLYITDYDDAWFGTETVENLGPNYSRVKPWIGYDNNNVPPLGDMTLPPVHPIHPGMIDPYVKNDAVKRCPDAPHGWQMALGLNEFNRTDDSQYYTVNPGARGNEFGPSVNMSKTDPATGLEVDIGADDAQVEEPSSTLVLWEHQNWEPRCNFLQMPSWLTAPPDDPLYESHFHFLHRNGSTTLWADGHVKLQIYSRLKRPWFSCTKSIYPAGSY